jgi:hypothetical protein
MKVDRDTISVILYVALTGVLVVPILLLYIPTFVFVSTVDGIAKRLEYEV